MPAGYQLIMRSGPQTGGVFPLNKTEISLGRDLTNDLVVSDPEVSRHHARLYFQGNTYILEDLGSTNGTFVNGIRLTGPYPLRSGETISLGERVVFLYEAVDEDATVVTPSSRIPSGGELYTPANVTPSVNSFPRAQSSVPPKSRYTAPLGSTPVTPVEYPVDSTGRGEPGVLQKSKTTRVLVISLGVVFVLTCLCIGVLLWNAPKEFWCLFPVWPAGACP
ncbi:MULTISPECIES: FHA domain-containing protein [Anaerolinea]|uniref:FHA domain-containing protein n=1 Tax=Anaerolinea TaxID=233189 RepID=UPI0026222803|nr:FHA domain-containing protein [Anaerolinea thermophila]